MEIIDECARGNEGMLGICSYLLQTHRTKLVAILSFPLSHGVCRMAGYGNISKDLDSHKAKGRMVV